MLVNKVVCSLNMFRLAWAGHASIADSGRWPKFNRYGHDLRAVPQRWLPARQSTRELRTVISAVGSPHWLAGKGESHGFRHHGWSESMEGRC